MINPLHQILNVKPNYSYFSFLQTTAIEGPKRVVCWLQESPSDGEQGGSPYPDHLRLRPQ